MRAWVHPLRRSRSVGSTLGVRPLRGAFGSTLGVRRKRAPRVLKFLCSFFHTKLKLYSSRQGLAGGDLSSDVTTWSRARKARPAFPGSFPLQVKVAESSSQVRNELRNCHPLLFSTIAISYRYSIFKIRALFS